MEDGGDVLVREEGGDSWALVAWRSAICCPVRCSLLFLVHKIVGIVVVGGFNYDFCS